MTETKGELQRAIEIYSRILERLAEDQGLAAKALYRLGWCHEKLGNQEAPCVKIPYPATSFGCEIPFLIDHIRN